LSGIPHTCLDFHSTKKRSGNPDRYLDIQTMVWKSRRQTTWTSIPRPWSGNPDTRPPGSPDHQEKVWKPPVYGFEIQTPQTTRRRSGYPDHKTNSIRSANPEAPDHQEKVWISRPPAHKCMV
jgi:hypothetical protein